MSERAGCLLGFLSWLIGRRGGGHDGVKLPKVMISNRFVSGAEADFFRVLQAVVGDRGHVLAQVSLNQLLYLPGNEKSNPGRAAWANKVARRSIDFLIVDWNTLRPLIAIELDEPSHATPRRQGRDEEVERLLEGAGLPLLRVLTSRTYDTRELEAAFAPHLSPSQRR